MFYIKYFIQNLRLTFDLIRRGQWRRIYDAIHARIYSRLYELIFRVKLPTLRAQTPPLQPVRLEVETKHPVAFSSPDHLVPHGTKYNNSTNKKFVLLMNEFFR